LVGKITGLGSGSGVEIWIRIRNLIRDLDPNKANNFGFGLIDSDPEPRILPYTLNFFFFSFSTDFKPK
jgi:hypothetical protein